MNKYNVFYILALIICIIQIWLPDYYVTGDGATHLYNASMLKSSWLNEYQAFYNDFYTKNAEINPNWFGHILLAIFQLFTNAVITEKFLISLYVILLAEGFRRVVFDSASKNYWSVIGVLFIFNHTLAKGFYNFNISIALGIWLLWACIRCLRNDSVLNYILIFFFAGITFITHPIGFLYSVLACVLITISYSFFTNNSATIRGRILFLIKKASLLGICIIPFIILVWYYRSKFTDIPIYTFQKERLEKLIYFKDFITYTSTEELWAKLVGYTLLLANVVLLSIGVIRRRVNKKYAGLLILPVVLLVLHLFIPDYMAGGGLMAMRTSQLFFLSLGISLAVLLMPYKRVSFFLNGWVVLVFAGISFARLPVLLSIGNATSEYLSVLDDVTPKSVLMPLSFSHNGKNTDGSYISDCNWLFQHVADYAAADKPLIVLDNYEANTGYFPFNWRPEANPYSHLTSAVGGIENQPPAADIAAYERESKQSIDYIVTWCYDSSFTKIEHVSELMSYIDINYIEVKNSSLNRAILYKKRMYETTVE